MGCGASSGKQYASRKSIADGTFADQGFFDDDADGRPEIHLENYKLPGDDAPKQTSTKKPVCVTGVSGFLGGHLVAQLLDAGYIVHGTVRRGLGDPRYAALRKLAPRLKLFKADLNADDGWDAAIEGCKYVFSVAADPFTLYVPEEDCDKMIDAHVNGTERVLRACARHTVKRVVMTSSIAAVVNHSEVSNKTFSEADWNTESTKLDAYFYAKTAAEKKGREVAAEVGIEFVTINPGGIVGPVQDSYTKIVCGAHLMDVMNGGMMYKSGVPFIALPNVDVRDVAKAHILAMTTTDASTHGRFICVSQPAWFSTCLSAVREHYGGDECPYPIVTKHLPTIALKLTAQLGLDPVLTVEYANNYIGVLHKFDTSRLQKNLGMTCIPFEQSWCDMADSFVKYGYVKDQKPKVSKPVAPGSIYAVPVPTDGDGKLQVDAEQPAPGTVPKKSYATDPVIAALQLSAESVSAKEAKMLGC